ncbi:MAG: hypothetical protein KJ626_09260 [Verrucomicrobia bacterium]|nr:hypothetical protein [Verrucomicrobiota bacterium]
MNASLTVCERRWLSDQIFELDLERNGISFVPGDCLALFSADGKTSRPYSIASGTDEKVLRFLIRRMEGGIVSPYLADRKPGDTVQISPPFGWFRPGAPVHGDRFVFVATGTGIAPFLSFFRSDPARTPIQCLHGVRKLDDACERAYLAGRCDLRLAVSREDHPDYFHGRVTGLLEDLPVADDINYYLCGLDSMIDEVSRWLEAKGVVITRIHRECFFNASYSA